jgi:hypothetical protein
MGWGGLIAHPGSIFPTRKIMKEKDKYLGGLPQDLWGRPAGFTYKKGKRMKTGWYFRGEFIATNLSEAKRIINERKQGEP